MRSKKLLTLRAIQRKTGIHWDTLREYAKRPQVQKHAVQTTPKRVKWKAAAIPWFMKWWQTRHKEPIQLELFTEDDNQLILTEEGILEYSPDSEKALRSVHEGADSLQVGSPGGYDPGLGGSGGGEQQDVEGPHDYHPSRRRRDIFD